MKHLRIILCLIMILLFLASCGKKENIQVTDNKNNFSKGGINYSEAVPSKKENAVVFDAFELTMSEPIRTDKEKLEYENINVIRGKVIKTETVLNTELVFTKSEIKVEEVFKGEIQKGEKVTIKELGGFISASDYYRAVNMEKYGNYEPTESDNSILDMRIKNSKVLEKGEEVILFLLPVKHSTISEFSGRCYEPLRAWQGKLVFNIERQLYIPYIPVDEMDYIDAEAYTLIEFRDFINSCN